MAPTGAGKTKFAIEIAKKTNGEIISADSRQIYKYLDIGTAKPTFEECRQIKFHLIDIITPDQTYSCGQFARDAGQKIEEIEKRGRLPMVCGGTGLYIRALFNPLHHLPQSDPIVKEKLLNILKEKGVEFLYKRLLSVDPQWASIIKPKDRQRILRGLEVYEITGQPLSELIKSKKPDAKYQPYYIGINLPREELYKKINERFDNMIKGGLIEEVKKILNMGYRPDCPGLRTIGYREIVAYLQGKLTRSEAIEKAKQQTRNFARRQLTWFGKIPDIAWHQPYEVAQIITKILCKD